MERRLRTIEAGRVRLRRLTTEDAGFIRELLNEPDFIRNIGDKGVRSEAEALRYIAEGPQASYARHGYGLMLVETREAGEAIGICGLLWRDWLGEADLGFATLARHWRRGLTLEAARAVVERAEAEHGLRRLTAITQPENAASIGLLERLGFLFERMVVPPGGGAELRLFGRGEPGLSPPVSLPGSAVTREAG